MNSRARPAGRKETPSVSPVFPLLLLQTMRDRDHPGEVFEDEDITLSLPRRLGLSEVVRVQIERFESEVRHKRLQLPSQVEDLVRLVIKRPDAEEIFNEAGRRVARVFWQDRSNGARRMIRLMPRPVALYAGQRASKRMMRRLTGRARFKIGRRPLTLRIEHALTVRAASSGVACAFYAGAFSELMGLYTKRDYVVEHTNCQAESDEPACIWLAETV